MNSNSREKKTTAREKTKIRLTDHHLAAQLRGVGVSKKSTVKSDERDGCQVLAGVTRRYLQASPESLQSHR